MEKKKKTKTQKLCKNSKNVLGPSGLGKSREMGSKTNVKGICEDMCPSSETAL